jgi:orotate phosphoribosyltransferase-like protein
MRSVYIYMYVVVVVVVVVLAAPSIQCRKYCVCVIFFSSSSSPSSSSSSVVSMMMLQETEKMALLNNGAIIPLLGVATAGIPLAVTKSTVLSALLAGYRHIDCAPPHEAEVGQAFREAFSQGMVRRDEVFVTSKLPSTAHEPQDVLQTVQKSLR